MIEADASSFCRVVRDMDNQTDEAIGEILPGTRSPFKAPLQQLSVDFGETQWISTRSLKRVQHCDEMAIRIDRRIIF